MNMYDFKVYAEAVLDQEVHGHISFRLYGKREDGLKFAVFITRGFWYKVRLIVQGKGVVQDSQHLTEEGAHARAAELNNEQAGWKMNEFREYAENVLEQEIHRHVNLRLYGHREDGVEFVVFVTEGFWYKVRCIVHKKEIVCSSQHFTMEGAHERAAELYNEQTA